MADSLFDTSALVKRHVIETGFWPLPPLRCNNPYGTMRTAILSASEAGIAASSPGASTFSSMSSSSAAVF
jgi:hypothetical protein